MKKILIIVVLFTSCYNVERNCIDFKTGEFEFSSYFNWEELLADKNFMNLIRIEVSREVSSRIIVDELIEYTEELLTAIRIHIVN